MSSEAIYSESRTLAERLAEARMTVPEALRTAMMLAEVLRTMHDAGRFHGAVAPRAIVLTGSGVELLPSEDTAGTITPYTAPEFLEGCPLDARGDIFAFGAVLYEMLTGRRAFAGEGASLVSALTSGTPEPSGSPMVDRLVGNCLAKDPAARWPRMQKVLMELKLLTVAARRAEPPAKRAEPAIDLSTLQAAIRESEARVAARLEEREKAQAEFERSAIEAIEALRTNLVDLDAQLAAAQERAAAGSIALQELESRIATRFAGDLQAAGQRIGLLEEAAAAHDGQAIELEERIAGGLAEVETRLKAQETAIQSARTAMGQTDDLVERVVEALETLHSAVLEQNEAGLYSAATT